MMKGAWEAVTGTLLIFLFLAPTASAQSPNLSGTWQLTVSGTTVFDDGEVEPIVQTVTLGVVQSGNTLSGEFLIGEGPQFFVDLVSAGCTLTCPVNGSCTLTCPVMGRPPIQCAITCSPATPSCAGKV